MLVADLCDRGDVEALPGRAGDVDVLVANAALPGSGPLDSFSPEQIDRALEVNLRAPMQLTRALLPSMLERERGHLVYVSSLVGKIPAAGSSIYSATKFGLRGFGGCRSTTSCMAPAWAPRPSSPASSATPGCSPTPA